MVKDLIEALARSQVSGLSPLENGEDIAITGQIAIGSGKFINTSSKMERLLKDIARELKQQNRQLKQSHTDKEWTQLVKNSFGPALASIDLDDDRTQSAYEVLGLVNTQLAKYSSINNCEHAFGCTLFGKFDVATFQIGPVLFEPREAWLNRKVKDKQMSAITARRVRLIWAGKKLRECKQPSVDMREQVVLKVIGGCPYVCSVSTQELGAEAGRGKAYVAAHLGMAAIALLWPTPSKALQGFNLLNDPGVRHQQTLTFTPDNGILVNYNMVGLPHGPAISAIEWRTEFKAYKDGFTVIGEAISYFLSASTESSRPRLMNTLVQSLLWFYEACRDEVDLMSVVKFSASLDALANGGKVGGIKRLINARLGIEDKQAVCNDGRTLNSVIDNIYSECRSRTIHGTNEKLGHDWSSTRLEAERLAKLCFISAIDLMVKKSISDDPKIFQKESCQ